MMSRLFWLSDEAWAAIEPFMPRNQPGARRVDDRRVISGIFHVLKSGCRWCDCPQDYGPHTTIYNRYNPGPANGSGSLFLKHWPTPAPSPKAHRSIRPM